MADWRSKISQLTIIDTYLIILLKRHERVHIDRLHAPCAVGLSKEAVR
jgi:hypothetical protein